MQSRCSIRLLILVDFISLFCLPSIQFFRSKNVLSPFLEFITGILSSYLKALAKLGWNAQFLEGVANALGTGIKNFTYLPSSESTLVLTLTTSLEG